MVSRDSTEQIMICGFIGTLHCIYGKKPPTGPSVVWRNDVVWYFQMKVKCDTTDIDVP